MKPLSIDKAVDKHLKPVKDSDGTLTALEVSTDDVRVKKNLNVGKNTQINGDASVSGDLTLGSDIISTPGATIFIIDCAGSIKLDSSSGQTYIVKDGTNFGWFDTDTGSTLKLSSATDYHLSLHSQGTGNIVLDSNGDIEINSEDGNFIIKNAGSEFSVRNSAYAGMILGYTTAGIDTADASYTLTATTALVHSSLNVSFIAPPSGVVEIMAQIYFDAARRLPVLSLLDNDDPVSLIDFPNANDVTNEHVQAFPPSAGGDSVLRPHWVVTGLTPGTTYKWWLGAKTSGSTGGVLRWGGNVTNEYPPFIMRATALPTAVTNFAVYG